MFEANNCWLSPNIDISSIVTVLLMFLLLTIFKTDGKDFACKLCVTSSLYQFQIADLTYKNTYHPLWVSGIGGFVETETGINLLTTKNNKLDLRL